MFALPPIRLLQRRDPVHCEWCADIVRGLIDPNERGADRGYSDGWQDGVRWAAAHPVGYELPIALHRGDETVRGINPDVVVAIRAGSTRVGVVEAYAHGFFAGVTAGWCHEHPATGEQRCTGGADCRRAIAAKVAYERHMAGPKLLPDPEPIVCGGRKVDDAGQPSGKPCGKTYQTRGTGLDDAELTTRARLAGWAIGHHQGARSVMCPACRKPNPSTAAICRELDRSTT